MRPQDLLTGCKRLNNKGRRGNRTNDVCNTRECRRRSGDFGARLYGCNTSAFIPAYVVLHSLVIEHAHPPSAPLPTISQNRVLKCPRLYDKQNYMGQSPTPTQCRFKSPKRFECIWQWKKLINRFNNVK